MSRRISWASSRSCRGTTGRRRAATASRADLSKTTLEAPLGSGPYRIKSLETGRSITYERGRLLGQGPARGQRLWNFDEITFAYYRDRVPAFESFKSRHLDVWRETSATAWATQYDFDAVRNAHPQGGAAAEDRR